MDHSHAGTLNRSGLAWALESAIRYAIATAIAALILAVALPDTGAERFATTAYLALIFVAIVLAVRRLAPGAAADEPRPKAKPSFPSILGFLVGLVILVAAVAGYATDPRTEVQLIVYCLCAVGVAAVTREGALKWLHGQLVADGRLEAIARYATVVAVLALVLSALFGSLTGEVFAAIAYAAMALMTPLRAYSLAAPTPLGAYLRRVYAEGADVFSQLATGLVFARMIDASVVALAASIAMASLLRRPYSEPFAAVAWGVSIFAAFGIFMECRRRLAEPSTVTREVAISVGYIDRRPTQLIERLARTLTPEGVIRYAAGTMVAAFLLAAPLWRHYAEPFVVIGYSAAIVLTLAVATACRQSILKRYITAP